MKEDRPGVLVCVCRADGKILLNAPYDCEDTYIQMSRAKRISARGQASNSGERGEGHAESGND